MNDDRMSGPEIEAEVRRLVQRDRERDRESGVLANVDASLHAVANGQLELARQLKDLRAELGAERTKRKTERAADRKEILRLAALPLSGLGFIVSGQVGSDPKPSQLMTTLIVLVIAGLFPELRDVFLRRREAPPPEVAERSNGLASDPPAPNGH